MCMCVWGCVCGGHVLNLRSKGLEVGGVNLGMWVHFGDEKSHSFQQLLQTPIPPPQIRTIKIQQIGPKSRFLAPPSLKELPFVKPVC